MVVNTSVAAARIGEILIYLVYYGITARANPLDVLEASALKIRILLILSSFWAAVSLFFFDEEG